MSEPRGSFKTVTATCQSAVRCSKIRFLAKADTNPISFETTSRVLEQFELPKAGLVPAFFVIDAGSPGLKSIVDAIRVVKF